MAHPWVIFDDLVYRMWYTGAGSRGEGDRIGSALSADGVAWVRSGEGPCLGAGGEGAWDERAVRNASVVREAAGYRMWYEGESADGTTQIGCATSPDGETWTRCPENPVVRTGAPGEWDEGGAANPSILVREGTYEMWYAGGRERGDPAAPTSVGHAISADGVHWTKDVGNPAFEPSPPVRFDDGGVSFGSVIEDEGSVQVWYSGWGAGEAARISYAVLSGGISWTRFIDGPVIGKGAAGEFDELGQYDACVVVVEPVFHLWYTGLDSSGRTRIGCAERIRWIWVEDSAGPSSGLCAASGSTGGAPLAPVVALALAALAACARWRR